MRYRLRNARVLLRSIKFHNLHVIVSLKDDQNVEVRLMVYCLNVQSLKNKAIPVDDYVVSQGVDVLALTETCLGTDTDQVTINDLVPAGSEFNHFPRKSGGGIGILYKSGLNVSV